MPDHLYIDGRDPDATPPLTLARLNVWGGLPRSRNQIVGQVKHGARVRVFEVEYDDGERRWFARIRKGLLTGWVPGDWLSEKREAPVGDLYEPARRAKRRRRRAR
jgi:hypothetical protein